MTAGLNFSQKPWISVMWKAGFWKTVLKWYRRHYSDHPSEMSELLYHTSVNCSTTLLSIAHSCVLQLNPQSYSYHTSRKSITVAQRHQWCLANRVENRLCLWNLCSVQSVCSLHHADLFSWVFNCIRFALSCIGVVFCGVWLDLDNLNIVICQGDFDIQLQ